MLVSFPAFEIWRMLPGRRELLEGVLSANLIGFHTRDYSRHFQKSCERIVFATAGIDSLTYKDFTAQLGTYPIGIDPNKFLQALEKPAIESILAEYKKEFKGRKVLLGIDRLVDTLRQQTEIHAAHIRHLTDTRRG